MPKLLSPLQLLRACLFALICAAPMGAAASVTQVEVHKLYVAILGRPVNVAELSFWVGNPSMDVDTVADTVSSSNEFLALTAGMSLSDKITFIYQQNFARTPDVGAISYWTDQVNTGLTLGGFAWALTFGASGADLTLFNDKVTAAQVFCNALDTAPEIIAYNGTGPYTVGRAYISRVVDGTTLAAEIAPAALDATLQQMMVASYTPTRTPTRTATATVTRTVTVTPSRTPTPSPTVTPSPSVSATHTPMPTPGLSPVLSPTAGVGLGAAALVVLGPVPAKRGVPICLGSDKAVSGGHWDVYNVSTPPQKVASLSFGAQAQGCLATGSLAPGVYFVDCTTQFSDGGRDRRLIKIVVAP